MARKQNVSQSAHQRRYLQDEMSFSLSDELRALFWPGGKQGPPAPEGGRAAWLHRPALFTFLGPCGSPPRNVSHVNTHSEHTEISTLIYCSIAHRSKILASSYA